MRIAVISDTHDNKEAIFRLVDQLNSENIDVVIHAGDHIAPFTVDWMAGIKRRVIGVAGNNDAERELLRDKYAGHGWSFTYDIAEVDLDGLIAVYHGTVDKVLDALIGSGKYSVVIHGHLHKVIIKEYDNNVLRISPGEVCGYLTGKRTYMVLRMPDKDVDVIEF